MKAQLQLTSALASMLVVTVLTQASQAALVAEESFLVGTNPAAGEYFAGPINPGPGQSPANPGFTGPWLGTTNTVWAVQEEGLSRGVVPPGFTLASSGGSARYQSSLGEFAFIRRELAAPPAFTSSGLAEFWMAGLVHLHGLDTSGTDGFAWAGFASDNSNNNQTQGWKIGFDHVGGNMDLVYRHRAADPSVAAASFTLIDGVETEETYLVVLRGRINHDLGGSAVPGNDNIDFWINPADISSELALGAPDVSVEDFSVFSSEAFRYFVLEANNLNGLGASFDEFRLGATFGDVVPLVFVQQQIIPEPSALALLGLGGIGIALRRRSRGNRS